MNVINPSPRVGPRLPRTDRFSNQGHGFKGQGMLKAHSTLYMIEPAARSNISYVERFVQDVLAGSLSPCL